jgi:hypothetical protein
MDSICEDFCGTYDIVYVVEGNTVPGKGGIRKIFGKNEIIQCSLFGRNDST